MRQVNRPQLIVRVKCQECSVSKDKSIFYVFLFSITFWWLVIATNSFALSLSDQINPILKTALTSQGLSLNKELQDKQFYKAMAAYERGEYYLAKRSLLPLAQQQYTEAEFYMGMIYDMGLGVVKTPATAVDWYQRAALKGYHHAQHNLAVAYANGVGIKQDMEKAIRWWQRAARQGNTDSQYNLGIVYATGSEQVKRDVLEAEKWWRKAAISGDAMAQFNLGALYANGEKKVTSYCEAIRWWQESARAGMVQAQEAIEILKQRDDYRPC